MSMVSSSETGGARDTSGQSSPLAGVTSHVPKKRPRPVVSCIECRKKKLKCDRSAPCNQCMRLDKTAQCVYQNQEPSLSQPSLVSEASDTEPGSSRKRINGSQKVLPLVPRGGATDQLPAPLISCKEKSGVIEELQARVGKLERLLSVHQQGHPEGDSEPGSGNSQERQLRNGLIGAKLFSSEQVENAKGSSMNHQGFLSLKGTRTRYFGPNHKLALLNRFENAMDFCQRGFPGLSYMMPEFKRFQKTIAAKRKTGKDTPTLESPTALSKMMDWLPPRDVCDHLVAVYFYNCEKALRIIPRPSFLRECQQFWGNQALPMPPHQGFVPQLYTIMAIGSFWDQSKVFSRYLESHGANEAVIANMVESWLGGLHWKRRIELSTLRTQCLLYLAHQYHYSAPMETIWTNAGTAVRMAITMGLHRDPNEFSNLSIFEGEQRRRLWATVVEIDLQASLVSGCPALVREGDYNCLPPANVDDDQLHEGMMEYPIAKPLDEWTDSTLQILLAKSFPLRLEAIHAASRILGKPDHRTFLEIGSKIEKYLDDLPSNVKFGVESSVGCGKLVGQMILDRYIRRVLVCLYRPFALGVAGDSVFFEGWRACIRNSLIILNQQDFWDPDVADLKIINSRTYWNAYYAFAEGDIMLAALTICLEIKALSEASSIEDLATRESGNNGVVWRNPPTVEWTKASLTRAVENTLNCLLRRLDDPGTDLRDPLALSMALQSARLDGGQDTTDSMMVAGASTVIKACRQHFHGSDSAAVDPGKQHDMNPSAIPVHTPHPSSGEAPDLTFADGSGDTYDGMSFPLEVDMDNGMFDMGLDVDWEWGGTWR